MAGRPLRGKSDRPARRRRRKRRRHLATVSGSQPSSAAMWSLRGTPGSRPESQRRMRRARKARAWGVEGALARRRRSIIS